MRIISWNSQGDAFGFGKVRNLIVKYDPDVICLQECGRLLGVENFEKDSRVKYKLYNFGTFSRDRFYHVFYYPWRNGCRCSMATLIKADYEIKDVRLIFNRNFYLNTGSILRNLNLYSFMTEDGDDISDLDTTGRKGLRPMLQTVIYISGCDKDSISVNNVHLPSGCPTLAKGVAKYFFDYCRGYYSYVVMIGDMNIPSFMWRRENPRYQMIAPDTKTHRYGNILDYAFTDLKYATIEADSDFRSSDHLAVILDL